MNHNIFEKILTKYWKERFEGVLGHMMRNFGLIPKYYEASHLGYWIGHYEVTFKSLPYLLLYNYKRDTCSICNSKHLTKDLRRCCLSNKIFFVRDGEDICSRIVCKYKWLYDGQREWHWVLYNKYTVYNYYTCCYVNLANKLHKLMDPNIIESFVP